MTFAVCLLSLYPPASDMQPGSPLPVRSYHGTSRATAELILHEGFVPSTSTYDWLGTGIYFWQDAPRRAREWAQTHHPAAPAVVAATIDLVGCIDLLDIGWQDSIAGAYPQFVASMARHGMPLPAQTELAHRLDRAVLEFFIGVLGDQGVIIRSVRAAFAEGEPLFPGSALTRRGHVQIAVRDPSTIRDLELLDA